MNKQTVIGERLAAMDFNRGATRGSHRAYEGDRYFSYSSFESCGVYRELLYFFTWRDIKIATNKRY